MGKKITIYQIDENETGPKTIEVGGSSLRAIYSPRSRLKEILSRPEYKNPGIYVLNSFPKENTFNERIYIGEADPLEERLKNHLSDDSKDFIECVSVFSSNAGELTKAHIKNMESKLYALATLSKNAEIDNSNKPTLSTLSEADESLVDNFILQIKLIFPLLGFRFLIPSTIISKENDTANQQKYKITRKGLSATMIINEQGYVILKGSTASKEIFPSLGSYKALRSKLIETKVLIESSDSLKFVENTIFSSPSAASCIVLGTASSGPEEWKTESGTKLKDIT
ncbi:GIY-YIG nuclease family protein [Leptospira sp. 201903070]|uniref:GIY-YIG nuclease family protein n=1 Tax=Leptospira ainlahdjerensis TaxID=2810033 RepID=A0ABS2UHC4_9LEPT|nr:GIY-YIG nuclease family protein [Leptospira ainlahdjerensis]MBM9578657.1 GIY-YIG nuclease family protein [Leptospira ainlahdjerensis]